MSKSDQVLTIVQDQQQILFPQMAYERVDKQAIRLLAYPKDASHRLRHELELREWC
jgi:hypothetical protein